MIKMIEKLSKPKYEEINTSRNQKDSISIIIYKNNFNLQYIMQFIDKENKQLPCVLWFNVRFGA